MNQPDLKAREEYFSIVQDAPTAVRIPGTRRVVRLRGVKPYTMERLTALWLERDLAAVKVQKGSDVLKDMAKEPYFAVREACIFALNSYWKLRLLYPIMWRVWAYLRGYTDSQMEPIILEGKKKLQLQAHWSIMAYSLDMRTDMMMLTKKEAEQYRAELLSAEKLLLSRTSRSTAGQGDSSSGSSPSGTGATVAS